MDNKESQSRPDGTQALAEERTETAWARTRLAEERTYAAWIRTGLAAVAAGFALVKLMNESAPPWLIRGLGVLLILAGGGMFILGFCSYRSALKQTPKTPLPGVPTWILGLLSLSLTIGAAAALILVIIA